MWRLFNLTEMRLGLKSDDISDRRVNTSNLLGWKIDEHFDFESFNKAQSGI